MPPVAAMRTMLLDAETSRRASGGVHALEHPYTNGMSEKASAEEILASEAQEVPGEECELCGTEMFGLHCKLICPNCGSRRDCSDP